MAFVKGGDTITPDTLTGSSVGCNAQPETTIDLKTQEARYWKLSQSAQQYQSILIIVVCIVASTSIYRIEDYAYMRCFLFLSNFVSFARGGKQGSVEDGTAQ